MRYNKKAVVPVWEFIVWIFIIVLLLGSWAGLLLQYNKVDTDERKLKTQLILNKVLDGNCFSSEYGTIEKQRFNQNSIDNCLEGLDKDTLVGLFLDGEEYYESRNEERFKSLANLCVQKSNKLCTEMKYPITLIDEDNSRSISILSVAIITT